MQVCVFQIQEVLKDYLVYDWALVAELLVKLCFVQCGELIFIAYLPGGSVLIRLLALFDGDQLAVLQYIVLQHL